MRERDATRKSNLEIALAMLIYTVVLFTSIYIAKEMQPGLSRTLVAMLPVIPILLAAWAMVRQFARMDEFVRLRTLQTTAITSAVVGGLSLTYGFLEGVGFPKLSMFWVWGVMGITWFVVTVSRCLVSR
jgi:hypothetical protein